MKKLCIYHADCLDGAAAAYAVQLALGDDVELHPGRYGEGPPLSSMAGREVILVDFSYKRPTLLAMAAVAESILILDHHKSAKLELVRLPSNVEAIFVLDYSGAAMAWARFHRQTPMPQLYEHIQDRDLWRFRLPGTKEITAYAFTFPLIPESIPALLLCNPSEMRNLGQPLVRAHNNSVQQLIEPENVDWMHLGGEHVPVANCLPQFASDVGHELAKLAPFSATYYDTADKRKFSLRSSQDGRDVSLVATRFGGGGHKHAAGFWAKKPQVGVWRPV